MKILIIKYIFNKVSRNKKILDKKTNYFKI